MHPYFEHSQKDFIKKTLSTKYIKFPHDVYFKNSFIVYTLEKAQ